MRRLSGSIGLLGLAVVLLCTALAGPVAATTTTPLTGVRSLGNGSCVVLATGRAACWGNGTAGQLGNGSYTSPPNGAAAPVTVKGVGGTGVLVGVKSLTGSCALLTSGQVDCWGYGGDGQLGNGTFYTANPFGSAVPVSVKGVRGTGTLDGVASLDSDRQGYCALLISGKVDCWGTGFGGGTSSAVPVGVEGVGGIGDLGEVVSLATDGFGFCAVLKSTQVDCWGDGYAGQLGNGQSIRPVRTAPPYPWPSRGSAEQER